MRTLIEQVVDLLRYSVSAPRFGHCRRVAACCRRIGVAYDIDPASCEFVGWAHDLAREWNPDHLLRFVTAREPDTIDPVEAEDPILLHGHASAIVVSNELGLRDGCLVEAVRYHTLGRPDFCDYGKALYCADYLEPGRPSVPEALRDAIGVVTLDELVGMVITDTRRRGYALSPRTEAMYRSLHLERYAE